MLGQQVEVVVIWKDINKLSSVQDIPFIIQPTEYLRVYFLSMLRVGAWRLTNFIAKPAHLAWREIKDLDGEKTCTKPTERVNHPQMLASRIRENQQSLRHPVLLQAIGVLTFSPPLFPNCLQSTKRPSHTHQGHQPRRSPVQLL